MGSTLVLGCKASALVNVAAATGYAPAFVLTKSSAATISVTVPTASTATNGAVTATGSPIILKPSGGTLLWDSVNGHTSGYDYILVTTSLPLATAFPSTGYIQIYIPYLRTTDAGSYYCTFYDGSGAEAGTGSTFANSGSFGLVISTITSGSARSATRSKAFEYSLALLGASKILF